MQTKPRRMTRKMPPLIQSMPNYVSPELVARLRVQQADMRRALLGLERRIDLSGQPHLLDPYRSLARAYRVHDGLVSALLEALEPDIPEGEPPT